MAPTRRSLFEIAALFLFSLFLFTVGQWDQEITGFDSRFYLFAQEMLHNGLSFFPTTYQQYYPDYPATSVVMIYLSAILFGGLNKLTAILPSAIAASITVVFTYLIGRLRNKAMGAIAVCLLFMTIAFLKSARSISLDMYPAMIAAACFYLIYSADLYHQHKRIFWIFPLLVLSFAFRGPIGLVIPTAVVCVYYFLDLNYKKFFINGLIAFILLIVCSLLLLTIANHVGGQGFMQDVLRMQIVGRIDNPYLPVYFYFVEGMGNYALSFPLACLVLLGLGYQLTQKQSIPEDKFLLKLFGWMMIILIGMSIPDDKKTRYVLAMVPAAALIAAYPFAFPLKGKYFYWLHKIAIRFFFYLPAILMLAVETIYFYAQKNSLAFHIHYPSLIIFLIGMQLVSIVIAIRYINKSTLREILIFFIASICFVATYIMAIERISLYVERGRDFVVAIENERNKSKARLVFYQIKPDGLAIKYLVNMPEPLPKNHLPLFIDDAASLLQYKSNAFFVTTASHYQALPSNVASQFEIVGYDKLGHVSLVVFKRK